MIRFQDRGDRNTSEATEENDIILDPVSLTIFWSNTEVVASLRQLIEAGIGISPCTVLKLYIEGWRSMGWWTLILRDILCYQRGT